MNGLYLYQGEFNGAPYYKRKMYCSSAYAGSDGFMYLFQSGYGWTVNLATYIANSTEFRAKCYDTGNDPFLCNNQWEFVPNALPDYINDAWLVSDACPQWNCAGIETNFDVENCNGPFTKSVDYESSSLSLTNIPNAWSNDAGDTIIYFNVPSWAWVCHTEYSPDCLGSYVNTGYAAITLDAQWQDIETGESILVSMRWPQSIQGQARNMTCLGSESVPTTASNTVAPSVSPSISPASNTSDTNPTSAPIISFTSSVATMSMKSVYALCIIFVLIANHKV